MVAKKPITIEEAYNRVASRCVLREYCRSDWYRKLQEAGLTAQQSGEVLDRLEEEKFIDEERYARSFVHDKLHYDRWGRVKMTSALRQKAISYEDIFTAISSIDQEEYLNILKDVLQKKAKGMKANSDYELKQKLARFAAGKGFEPGLVFKVLDLEETF